MNAWGRSSRSLGDGHTSAAWCHVEWAAYRYSPTDWGHNQGVGLFQNYSPYNVMPQSNPYRCVHSMVTQDEDNPHGQENPMATHTIETENRQGTVRYKLIFAFAIINRTTFLAHPNEHCSRKHLHSRSRL